MIKNSFFVRFRGGNSLRHLQFGVIGAGLAAAFATAVAVAVVPEQNNITQHTIVEALNIAQPQVLDHSGEVFFSETKIQRGDTLGNLLARMNINDPEAVSFLLNSKDTHAIRDEFIAGRSISANASGQGKLLNLHFPLSNRETALTVKRDANGFSAAEIAERPEVHVTTKMGTIETSLFGATDSANIPDSIAIQMAEIFSSEIDFHSDLRKGDRFIVSYEMRYSGGQATQSGRILAAEFINDEKRHQAIWFERNGKQGEYLAPDGKPLKKTFLRSPLEFSRVSSGFSMRFHPILKTWRAHQGVDYAAPTGTPIRATANATVHFVGKQNGYGNTIILRHDEKHSTLYAHLSKFKTGLRVGQRISQGDTIGYVGQTGWATGPHLHYEFKIHGKPVNPLSITLPIANTALDQVQLSLFKKNSQERLALLQRLGESNTTYID